jgi:AraC family transcriptional regulator
MRLKSSLATFSGKLLQRRELASLSLIETVYPSGLKMSAHAHEPAYFSLVLEGGYTEQIGSKTRDCKPAYLLFHPAGEYHAVTFHSPSVRIFRLEVKPEWLNRAREYGLVIDQPVEFTGGWSCWLAIRLYNEFREMDEASPLAIEGIALELLAESARCQKSKAERQPPRWLDQAREFLNAQFSETISLEAIADAVGVHPVYLAREFRRHFNCTISEYVRRLRVECASRALAASDAPIVDIAASNGFYDQSHFSRTFKRCTGLTPAEFRTTFRAG